MDNILIKTLDIYYGSLLGKNMLSYVFFLTTEFIIIYMFMYK